MGGWLHFANAPAWVAADYRIVMKAEGIAKKGREARGG